MKSNNIRDLNEELTKRFGEVGSIERKNKIKQVQGEFIASQIFEARKSVNMTQEALAKKLNVDKGYISRIERGLIIPNIVTFYKIVSAMGMSVELKIIKSK